MSAPAGSSRALIIEIAKMWPGHEGVNYETTKLHDLLLLIKEAVEGDRETISGLRKGTPDQFVNFARIVALKIAEIDGDQPAQNLKELYDRLEDPLFMAELNIGDGDSKEALLENLAHACADIVRAADVLALSKLHPTYVRKLIAKLERENAQGAVI